MIHRLFCKHNYNYYHTSDYIGLDSSTWKRWHYVCDKCGKKNFINERAFREFSENIGIKVALEEAKGVNNSEYENLAYKVMNTTFYGKNAYYAHKRLRTFGNLYIRLEDGSFEPRD